MLEREGRADSRQKKKQGQKQVANDEPGAFRGQWVRVYLWEERKTSFSRKHGPNTEALKVCTECSKLGGVWATTRGEKTVLLFFILFYFFGQVTCGILVPQPGIKLMLSALEAWSLNHWTTREVLRKQYFYFLFYFFGQATCGILVPQPGIKLMLLPLEAQSLNHWTTREVLRKQYF